MIPHVVPPLLVGLVGQLLTEQSERDDGVRAATSGIASLYNGDARTSGLTDKLVCPGVDLDAFKANCRAKVFRDMWNYWKLLRSSADGITPDKLATAARALMTLVSQDAEGKIRHVEVQIGKLANPWETPVLENRNAVCMTPMTLRASDYAPAYYEVFVRFVYRGVENDLLWPARKIGAAGWASNTLGVHCPVGADWLLDAIYTPSQTEVPSPESDPTLPPLAGDIIPDVPDVDLSTKLVVGGLGVLALAAVAGYAVRSFR